MAKLNFTQSQRSIAEFETYEGRIIDQIPNLVDSGMKFANYRVVANARNPSKNYDLNNRNLLYNNYFDLAGNPVIAIGGERLIVCDLEHKDLTDLKKVIAGLNPNTQLNDTHSLDLDDDLIDAVRKAGGVYVMNSKLTSELFENPNSNKHSREEVYSALFQNNIAERNDYFDLVKNHHKVDDLAGIMGFYPGRFSGMRLLCFSSVGDCQSNAGVAGICYLDDIQCHLLGVGDGVETYGTGALKAQQQLD